MVGPYLPPLMILRTGRGQQLFAACFLAVLLGVFVGCSSQGDPFNRDALQPVIPVGTVSPPNNATNVSPDTLITITFPLDLDERTVTKDNVHVLDYSLADTLGTLEKDKKPRVLAARVLFDPKARVVTVIPDQPLAPSARYQVLLQDVRSTTDILFNTVVTQFTTGATNRPVPNVISVLPPTGASLVPDTTPITLTFDRPMDQVTTLRALSVGPGIPGTASFAVGVDRTVLVFTPGPPDHSDGHYPAGQRIDITLRSDATDKVGTRLARSFTSFFTVEPPPRVNDQLTLPFNGQTRVPQNTSVTLVFTTQMTTATIANGFSMQTGSTLITPANGTFTFADGGSPLRTTAVFTPANPLPATTSVIIRVTGAAKSIRGVGLDPLFVSTFVTGP